MSPMSALLLILIAILSLEVLPLSPSNSGDAERQLTHGNYNHDLDDNINFSPDGRFLVYDCRGKDGIGPNRQLGRVEIATGKEEIIYRQPAGESGVGAASFLNDHEVIAIHSLIPVSGAPAPPAYDFTERGGMIIAADGSGRRRWLDSRNVIAPFTPGALRGGTHKHEPDGTGQWIGFTYNDAIMKARGSDLRNVGVSKRGTTVQVPTDSRNFIGESFSVLLTACVDHPQPGSDQIQRAEGDCWVGTNGFTDGDGKHRRARAFRGLVAVNEDKKTAHYSDVFVVTVPDDITIPGSLGPLEGTQSDYPKPPAGTVVRRLTHTSQNPDRALRGVSGHIRACGDGSSIVFVAKVRHGRRVESQLFLVSPRTGSVKQLSSIDGGVAGDPRFSPDGSFVAVPLSDGSVCLFSTVQETWGRYHLYARPSGSRASNLVIAPNSKLVAFNRTVGSRLQVFVSQVR